jgi:hypothetical protein
MPCRLYRIPWLDFSGPIAIARKAISISRSRSPQPWCANEVWRLGFQERPQVIERIQLDVIVVGQENDVVALTLFDKLDQGARVALVFWIGDQPCKLVVLAVLMEGGVRLLVPAVVKDEYLQPRTEFLAVDELPQESCQLARPIVCGDPNRNGRLH